MKDDPDDAQVLGGILWTILKDTWTYFAVMHGQIHLLNVFDELGKGVSSDSFKFSNETGYPF